MCEYYYNNQISDQYLCPQHHRELQAFYRDEHV